MKGEEKIRASAWGRFFEVGSLVGRAGVSFLGNKALNLFQGEERRGERWDELWTLLGDQFFHSFGRLKGGVMKIGQMLSMYDGLLPREFLEGLARLQNQAPALSIDRLREQLTAEIPAFDELVERVEEQPFAAASIGQVHRAYLRDGRVVAMKIQYPDMERVIHGDLRNLKSLFRLLNSLIFKIELEPFWREVKERLFEELDYERELANKRLFREFFRDWSAIIIPEPVPELCTRHVLTTVYEPGLPLTEAEKAGQATRDAWGELLFRAVVAMVFDLKTVHADPHPGNFNFREDGRIVIYDFGSVKKIPAFILDGYRLVINSLKTGRPEDRARVPEHLKAMGIHFADGAPVETGMLEKYVELMKPVFVGFYRFQKAEALFPRLVELGRSEWSFNRQIVFPPDVIFIDRAYGGLIGNITALEAGADWGRLVLAGLEN